MTIFQRLVLAIAILEIPLQIDTYLLYHEGDAEFGAIGGLNISLTSLCLLVIYGLWFVELAVDPQRNREFRGPGLPILLYFAAVCLSAVVAERPLFSFFELALLTQAVLLFVFLVNRLRDRDDVLFLLTTAGISVALQGAFVIGSRVTGRPMVGETISFSVIHMDSWMDGRPCGTLSTPNAVGSFLATLIVPVASLLFVPASRFQKSVAIVAVGAGSLAVVMTQSRASILALGIAFMIFAGPVFWRGWMPRWVPVLAIVLAAMSAVSISRLYRERVADGDQGSAESRVHLAKISGEVIREHPLLGVGAGNYHVAARTHAGTSPFRSEWFYTVHSKYLLVWAETGLIGLVGFLLSILTILFQGWSAWRADDRTLSPVALAFVAGLTGHLVHMLVDIFNSRPAVQMLWLCLGLLVCTARLCVRQERTGAMPTDENRKLASHEMRAA